jgi:hypothetical protein
MKPRLFIVAAVLACWSGGAFGAEMPPQAPETFTPETFTRTNDDGIEFVIKIVDGQGRFSGSSIRRGNSTSFYDGRGRYTGSSINTGPQR